ncbi:MAG: beta-glucosidase [Epulopiscium sp. Nele67-Bin002]|nr:MAG: beta-glucosidase [Epulopiscium sp. Nele67-Bin002]
MTKFAKLSRIIAAQGAVLLKNESDFLPLQDNENVAVFGRCQFDYYRSGTGSGGSVNVEYATDFINSLKEREKVNVNEEVFCAYKRWVSENPVNKGDGSWASEPWSQEEMRVDEELIKNAATVSSKAIIIIGRTAGEDKDYTAEPGSYYLTDVEQQLITNVCKHFGQVGVVLNVSNIIDMSWENDDIDMIIYAWQGGMEGGNAIVDVIVGDITPCGKLPDTIAHSIDDYPSTKNHGGSKRNLYQEDIYVGYRYFETFAPQKVKYPFGFGLSYTTFEVEIISECKLLSEYHIDIKVTNTGDTYGGREVIQVYSEPPQGYLGKPTCALVGFKKTKYLEPGESEEFELVIPLNLVASYDDSGATRYKSAYVLEQGEYLLHISNSCRYIYDTVRFTIPHCLIVTQLYEALAPTTNFSRIKPLFNADGEVTIAYEKVPVRNVDLVKRIKIRVPNEIEYTGDKGYKLQQVRDGEIVMEEFIAQLSREDLEILVRGEGMSHPDVTPGTASAFGGVTEKLRAFGIPLVCAADGPSGIRMENGSYATQLPIGTLLASTWDTELIERLYVMEGKELKENYIDVLLGPGLNIHRNPLNGRNFEYFSEDPILTGKMAAAVVRGIKRGGANATLKHFACNSQESYRHEIEAIVSERALREIYLRGFEIAIKEGEATSVMTAYNPINGHWCASNYDLNTTILREQWRFKGIVMTDWWARMNYVIDGGPATRTNVASMIKSQNDIYMVVGNYGAETNENNDNLSEALNSGWLALGELQRCAMNICKFVMATRSLERNEQLFSKPQLFEAMEANPQVPPLVDLAIDIREKTEQFYFDQAGVYQVDVTYSSIAKGFAQTTCNILLNNKLMTTIQVGNTKGESVTKKLATVQLVEGAYELKLDYVSGELSINRIAFVPIHD